MKSSLLKLYIFAFLFVGDFVMFAQEEEEPGDEGGDCPPDDPDCLEGSDPSAPINGKLILLAIVGISFALYYYNRRKQEKQIQA